MCAKRWFNYWTAGFAVIVLSCLFCGSALGAGPTCEELVGDQVLHFSLPSAQGRLADYGGDYYGRHHLILTFFPAAFTPV